MIKTISYLGLGTMGNGMASNLLKAGYEVTVWIGTLRNVSRLLERARALPIRQRTLSAMSIWSCIA